MPARWTRGALAAAAGALACAPLPVRWDTTLEGRVVSSQGRPLPGAVVVVRRSSPSWLPIRHQVEATELRADAAGRFALDRRLRPGLLAWPWGAPETSLVIAWAPGHRCSDAARPAGADARRVELEPVPSPAAQLASCPELADPGLPRYRAARALLSAAAAAGPREAPRWRSPAPRPVDPAAARSRLAPAANCSGPVLDLALDPTGRFVAWQQAERAGIAVWVAPAASGATAEPRRMAALSRHPARRLHWQPDGELVATTAPGSRVWGTPDEETPRRLWRVPRAPSTVPTASRRPAGDRVPLPGQACVPAPFAAPHERVAGGGRFLFDLRWIEAGCRAVRVDLETRRWTRIDRSADTGRCRESARLTQRELRSLAPLYEKQLAARLAAVRSGPDAAFTLWIEPARTRIEVRDWLGASRWLEAPSFPIDTPLRRIEVR